MVETCNYLNMIKLGSILMQFPCHITSHQHPVLNTLLGIKQLNKFQSYFLGAHVPQS